jgi:hypothetical protein
MSPSACQVLRFLGRAETLKCSAQNGYLIEFPFFMRSGQMNCSVFVFLLPNGLSIHCKDSFCICGCLRRDVLGHCLIDERLSFHLNETRLKNGRATRFSPPLFSIFFFFGLGLCNL